MECAGWGPSDLIPVERSSWRGLGRTRRDAVSLGVLSRCFCSSQPQSTLRVAKLFPNGELKIGCGMWVLGMPPRAQFTLKELVLRLVAPSRHQTSFSAHMKKSGTYKCFPAKFI